MIKTAGLELAFEFRGETEFTTQYHPEYETLKVGSIGERETEPGLYPILDPIGAVPTPAQNRDQPRASDRTGPIDALSFEMPSGSSTLSLHAARPYNTPGAGVPPGGAVLYFECEALDAKVAELKAHGVVFETEPTDQP